MAMLLTSLVTFGQIKKPKEKNNFSYVSLSLGGVDDYYALNTSSSFGVSFRQNLIKGLGVEGYLGINLMNDQRFTTFFMGDGGRTLRCDLCDEYDNGYWSNVNGLSYGISLDYLIRTRNKKFGFIPKVGLFRSTRDVAILYRDYDNNGSVIGWFRDDNASVIRQPIFDVMLGLDISFNKIVLGYNTNIWGDFILLKIGYVLNNKTGFQ